MPSIITDTFDYNDIIRVLDQDEAFVHHQVDDLQPKYWRIMQKAKTKCFFILHFFDRYRERTGLPQDTPKMDVIKDWINNNQHLNSDVQGNEKYPDGIFCAYPSGVALGRELPDGNSEMKTFVTYEMLRGEQIEKGESQSKAAISQEEQGHKNRDEIVEKLARYKKAGLISYL